MTHRPNVLACLLAASLAAGCSGTRAGRESVPGTGSVDHGAARATADRLPAPPDPVLAPAPPPVAAASPPPGESVQACIDRELTRRGLNPFGDLAGTAYPRGTPVPASSIERFSYVLGRHPEIRTACEASTPFR